MSRVKSFSVGNGDMYYIRHGSDNFSVVDCCIDDSNKKRIVSEIIEASKDKEIKRFISTHPDDDHIRGLTYLYDNWHIYNFYCVKNEATKKDETPSFTKYCELRDSEKQAFYLRKGVTRKWMNTTDDERSGAALYVLWPEISDEYFKEELMKVKEGAGPNNISPIFEYRSSSARFMWMGDIEANFLEKVKDNISFCVSDVLFAPHHGRDSGKVPSDILKKIKPKVIVIGEAPSKDLNYYAGYNTITQNSAGDITFENKTGYSHVYVSNPNYSVNFLENLKLGSTDGKHYLGSIKIER